MCEDNFRSPHPRAATVKRLPAERVDRLSDDCSTAARASIGVAAIDLGWAGARRWARGTGAGCAPGARHDQGQQEAAEQTRLLRHGPADGRVTTLVPAAAPLAPRSEPRID